MLNSSPLYFLFLHLNTPHIHSCRILRDWANNKLFQDLFFRWINSIQVFFSHFEEVYSYSGVWHDQGKTLLQWLKKTKDEK